WVKMEIGTPGADTINAVFAVIESMNHEMIIGMNVLMEHYSWWKTMNMLCNDDTQIDLVGIKVKETCYKASEPSSKVNKKSKKTANCASEQVGQVENVESMVENRKKPNRSMVAMSQETHLKEVGGRGKKFLASKQKSADSEVNKCNGARIRGSRVRNRTTKKDVKVSKPGEDRAVNGIAVLM
uniref:Gag-pol polyprotein n=1 Tax=Panagrellus redivivus TaxID=6233 RepID=A0A7E4VZM8_PANRE